jgi:hypothetical protein
MSHTESLSRRDRRVIFAQRCELRIKHGFACSGFVIVALIMAVTAYYELGKFEFNLTSYYQYRSGSFWTWVLLGGGLLFYTARVSLSGAKMLRNFSRDMKEGVKHYGRGIVVSVFTPYRAKSVAMIDMLDGSPQKWARPGFIQYSALQELQSEHRQVEFWYLPHSGFAWGVESQSAEFDDQIIAEKKRLWIWLAIGAAVLLALSLR